MSFFSSSSVTSIRFRATALASHSFRLNENLSSRIRLLVLAYGAQGCEDVFSVYQVGDPKSTKPTHLRELWCSSLVVTMNWPTIQESLEGIKVAYKC